MPPVDLGGSSANASYMGLAVLGTLPDLWHPSAVLPDDVRCGLRRVAGLSPGLCIQERPQIDYLKAVKSSCTASVRPSIRPPGAA
jgi:hypothetical protein